MKSFTRVDPHVNAERVPARKEAVTFAAGQGLGALGQVSPRVCRQCRLERETFVAHVTGEGSFARMCSHMPHQIRLFPVTSTMTCNVLHDSKMQKNFT